MFLASTVAPGTLPPFSSSTSPCTLPVVACPCPNAVFKHTKLSATANATHNNFFIVLAPETETPYPQEGNSPEVGGARGFQDWSSVGALAQFLQVSGLWKTFQRFAKVRRQTIRTFCRSCPAGFSQTARIRPSTPSSRSKLTSS